MGSRGEGYVVVKAVPDEDPAAGDLAALADDDAVPTGSKDVPAPVAVTADEAAAAAPAPAKGGGSGDAAGARKARPQNSSVPVGTTAAASRGKARGSLAERLLPGAGCVRRNHQEGRGCCAQAGKGRRAQWISRHINSSKTISHWSWNTGDMVF